MTSLFGHLAMRFASGPENLATEAMAYILTRSAGARRAMAQTAAALELHLPAHLSFRTQVTGEDSSIPDLAALDPDGRAVLLVENKFWAGLTPNQPAAYLARLPPDRDGLLLFVVPQRRLHTVWPDLVTSAATAGVSLPAASSVGENLLAARIGPHRLAVTSWPALIGRMEAAAKLASEDQVLADIAQLLGLCEAMDSTGFVPASMEELTNREVPRRLLSVVDLIPELTDRAVACGIADIKGLRPTNYYWGSGRYIRIGAIEPWMGIDHRHWARFGIGPLWLVFGKSGEGRAQRVLEAVAGWTTGNPVRAFDVDGTAVIPLRIKTNSTSDIVLTDLLSQLQELHALIGAIRRGPASASPFPDESPEDMPPAPE